MDVRVLSQREFDNLLTKNEINDRTVASMPRTVFISIIGSSPSDKSHFKREHPNVLILTFDDLSAEEAARIKDKEVVLFNEDHARRIIQFMEKNRAKDYCMVHCAAGVSRSGAVGTFINDFFCKTDYFTFMNMNRTIKPNAYILSTLKKVYYESDRGGE